MVNWDADARKLRDYDRLAAENDRLRNAEHIVRLSAAEARELRRWLERPNGSRRAGRAAFEAVAGGGILVRTEPYRRPGLTAADIQADLAGEG